jgi:hypothetical protein
MYAGRAGPGCHGIRFLVSQFANFDCLYRVHHHSLHLIGRPVSAEDAESSHASQVPTVTPVTEMLELAHEICRFEKYRLKKTGPKKGWLRRLNRRQSSIGEKMRFPVMQVTSQMPRSP